LGLAVSESVTLPEKPFTLFTRTEADRDEPNGTLTVMGWIETVKSSTRTSTCSVWTSPPLLPVTVTVKFSGGVFDETEIVSVELSFPFATRSTVGGVKFVDNPVEETLADRLTKPVNPFRLLTLIVETPEAPACTATVGGFALRVKSTTIAVRVME